MAKWNLVFDLGLCSGCLNCVVAAKDEYVDNDFPGYSAPMPRHGHDWIEVRRRERGSFPMVDVAHLFRTCQHCDDAPCIEAAKDGAIGKRDDGIVVIDPRRARGQRQIVGACAYGAVHWNEAASLPQHWNFDAHLIDAGWAAPRAVQACPTGALRAFKVEDDEMRRIAAAEGLERLPSGEKHGTRVYYRNLARYMREFVGGTLVGTEAGLEACVSGAKVRLSHGGKPLGEAASDAYGDFRFDGIAPSSGSYRVEVSAPGYAMRSVEFELKTSLWLGEIRLDPAR